MLAICCNDVGAVDVHCGAPGASQRRGQNLRGQSLAA